MCTKRFRSDSVLLAMYNDTFGPGHRNHLSKKSKHRPHRPSKNMCNTTRYLFIYLSIYLSINTIYQYYLFFFPSKCVPICHVKTTTNPSNFRLPGKSPNVTSRGTPPYPVGHNWSTPCSVANPGCPNKLHFLRGWLRAQISWGSQFFPR